MRLRLFASPADHPDADTRFAWRLLDARGAFLREGTSVLAEVPDTEDVELVLPVARVLFARLALPKVGAKTLKELLPFAVEDSLLADPDQIHAVAGRANAQGESVVAVVDRRWLKAQIDTLADAGFAPRRAWCETALVPKEPAGWTVIAGKEHGFLVDGDGLAMGFDVAPDGSPPLAIRLALQEAANHDRAAAKLVIISEAPLGNWSEDLGVPVEMRAPPKLTDAVKVDPAAINLLEGEFAPKRQGEGIAIPRSVAIAAAVLAAALGLQAVLGWWTLSREAARLGGEQDAIFRNAFPEAKAVVDPPLQMARNLAALQRSRGVASETDFLALASELGRALAATPGKVKRLDYQDGRLTSNAEAAK
jgi:general secretion pathway protein L